VTETASPTQMGAAAPGTGALRRVLVVDDSKMQRKILSASLSRSGYEVIEAASGEEALKICAEITPDLVLSDWMMPGMTGLEFCRAFRAMERQSYGYFILLTSKNETAEIAHGLEAGADDFLTKPVSGQELRARLAAGERIVTMQAELVEKNRVITSTLDELQGLYDSIHRDLVEARKLQQSLVKERHRSFGESEVSLLLRPSGHVGGDLVGFFPINSRRVGVYGIDVSGHGITSALMTVRLAGYLSGSSPDQNVALVQNDFGLYDGRPPAELAAHLNALVLGEMQTETYFTLAYADIDLVSGEVALVQAGHPHPAILRAGGAIDYVGEGGLPVGLIDGAEFAQVETVLNPGDRLILMSDGIIEAENPRGEQLGEAGTAEMLARLPATEGPAFLEAMMSDLSGFTAGVYNDDLSAALFDFGGGKVFDT